MNGVSSIRCVLRRCNAIVGEQITAPLPAVTVPLDNHQLIYPFAAVGIDYFGPLYVHAGPLARSMMKNPKLHKRYGCIFSCLRYRAVHIELASDLTTDSFINAVTRFVARRGPPRVIYSDNGSNFRGAETDVVRALKTWDQERIGRELLQRDIQWYFNSPAASHQGGAWERLIRSVWKILHAMIGEHLVNEETLVTFLVEVEKILNSRPITRVSSDPSDLEPLTPNHILLLRHNPCSAPSEFEDSDKFQARWKRVHILANEFWVRWVKKYMLAMRCGRELRRSAPPSIFYHSYALLSIYLVLSTANNCLQSTNSPFYPNGHVSSTGKFLVTCFHLGRFKQIQDRQH